MTILAEQTPGGTPPTTTAVAPAAPATAPAGASPQGGAPQEVKPPVAGTQGPRKIPQVTLTTEQLNVRLEQERRRASKQVLLDAYGTDDPTKIETIKAEAKKLKADAEKRDRESMTEQQRLQADLKKARDNEQRALAELAQAQAENMAREQGAFVENVARRHINTLYVADAALIFAKHLRDNVSPEDAAKLTERDVAKWFQDFAKKRPAFAASPAARQQTRTPLGKGNPAPPRPKDAAGPATNGQKTFRPGQPNSMTKAEVKAAASKLGYSWLDKFPTYPFTQQVGTRHRRIIRWEYNQRA